ncbi:MAG: DUF1800 domain-containing protein [Deltaproteobacteria bacterium]|nr:DUF1800 domain-containing protein [Deltaproteobacteria bacterium]
MPGRCGRANAAERGKCRGRASSRAGRTPLALLAALLAVASAAPIPPALATVRATRTEQRVLAGHLLRRLGFGPSRRDMHEALRLGPGAYLEQQLHPESIDDRLGERRFRPPPGPSDDGDVWQLRWLTRMAYSRRQLLEKMTLIWHEHFAVSNGKVGALPLMRDYEQLLRANALGNFRDLLIGMTRDNAMLIYLDNAYNNGQAVDELGNRIPPNENYARELLQLFSLGVHRLNPDGTLVLGGDGRPLPAYTEDDVKAVARALTGWIPHYPSDPDEEDPTEVIAPAEFADWAHDPEAKQILGEAIPADAIGGAFDVERVVAILMRHPNTAPFISKILIQKLATETPTPGYVGRVAAVFTASDGDLRAVVRAIVTDAEFTSPAVLRSQYKTPIEHIVGALRGLDARSGGNTLYYWTMLAGHLVYYPPSVFSFYRPGQKSGLVNAAYVATRDAATDMLAAGYTDDYFDAQWNAADLLRRQRLRARPQVAVELLARDLLAAPLDEATRQVVLDYLGPDVDEAKLRGAAWLILCSPDFQVN